MEKQICVKCGTESDNKLPLCTKCREGLKEFSALVEYLNSFTGRKEDLLWIIGSELSNRVSYIINDVNIKNDPDNRCTVYVPVCPGSSTVKEKPWLKKKYEHITQLLSEISKLRRAYGIAKQYYGVS